MSTIIDGANTYNFKLSDHKGNNNYFEIITNGSLHDAINIAQKHFEKEYGHPAPHIEKDMTGYPITKIF